MLMSGLPTKFDTLIGKMITPELGAEAQIYRINPSADLAAARKQGMELFDIRWQQSA